MSWPWSTKKATAVNRKISDLVESLDTRLTLVELRLKAVEAARGEATDENSDDSGH